MKNKIIAKNVEDAFNNGFKEYEYKEGLRVAKMIELGNKKLVSGEELKANVSTIIDGIVEGQITEMRLHIVVGSNIDFAIRPSIESKTHDFRLGDVKIERPKN